MLNIDYSGGLSVDQVRQQSRQENIYKLSSNESPLGPSPLVQEAIARAASSLNIYPPNQTDAFDAQLAAFHGRDLTAQQIISGSSGVELLDMICRAFLQPGDEVIVCPPTFGWYVKVARRHQAPLVSVPLKRDTMTIDVDAVLTAVTPRTRLFFLCNPQNPAGTMTTATEMARLIESLPSPVIVVADEVYHHFVTRDDYPDTLAYLQQNRPLIQLHSFSKAYGLAGLRLGYAITTPELAQPIQAEKRPFHLNSLALAGGTAALQDQAYLKQAVSLMINGRAYLSREFDRLGIQYWPSQTNFLMFRPPIDAELAYQKLLEAGIMVRPTAKNGLPGHLRISVGLPEANEAFVAALEKLMNQDGTG